jgi:hypothetical protein
MDTKLTLKLDKEVIELAKIYVKERGTSLSKFIEDYLKSKVEKSSSENPYGIDILPELLAMETGVDYYALNNLKIKSSEEEVKDRYDEKFDKYLKLDEE